jgi:hypothetical protein
MERAVRPRSPAALLGRATKKPSRVRCLAMPFVHPGDIGGLSIILSLPALRVSLAPVAVLLRGSVRGGYAEPGCSAACSGARGVTPQYNGKERAAISCRC